MLKVVSNTTPIISLLKLSRLDILKVLYTEIFIPYAVFQEIEAGKNKEFFQDLSKIDWINIVNVQDKHAQKYFLDLDAIESEAIVLATEIGADLIIIDETSMMTQKSSQSKMKIKAVWVQTAKYCLMDVA